MNGLKLRKQAQTLAETSLEEMVPALENYKTDIDLAALRIGYMLCRGRHELAKGDLIAEKIGQLEKELTE